MGSVVGSISGSTPPALIQSAVDCSTGFFDSQTLAEKIQQDISSKWLVSAEQLRQPICLNRFALSGFSLISNGAYYDQPAYEK